MKVLSIRQPWAWLILNAGKDIENRTWKTNFRGPFLVHASKGCTKDEYVSAVEFAREALDNSYRPITMPPLKRLLRGGIVGSAEIVDCVDNSESKWFVGDYGFTLRNAKELEFIPCKGRLGFFNVDITP